MILLFFGLTIANLLLLGMVFALGFVAIDADGAASTYYSHHVAIGIFAGLWATFVHVAVYTYFMATSKWLAAATDKANLPLSQYVVPAQRYKRRAFAVTMIAVLSVMATMFIGAAFDPTIVPGWPSEIHLVSACLTIAVHVLCALGHYRLLRSQGDLMDRALVAVNRELDVTATYPGPQADARS